VPQSPRPLAVDVPPNRQRFSSYEEISTHLSQSPALSTVFRSTHGVPLGSFLGDTTASETQLYNFFKQFKGKSLLQYVSTVSKATPPRRYQQPFMDDELTSLCADGHVNLEGCVLLASLVPEYRQYYVKTTSKQDANEDDIISSFMNEIYSLAPTAASSFQDSPGRLKNERQV
jgi:hypothetical protein